MRPWSAGAPALHRDRVLLGILLWTGLAGVLFFLLAGHTDWQIRVFWLAQPPLDAVLVTCAWRVCKIATGAVRRFWLVLVAFGGLFLAGDSYQATLTFVGGQQSSTTGGYVQTACLIAAFGSVLVAMLVHPQPGRSGRERLAFWLDSAAVLVGGAVVAWCFAATTGQPAQAGIVGTLVAAAVSLTATFAAVKMILSGDAPMHRAAAIPMISSAAVMSAGMLLSPNSAITLPAAVYLVRILPSALVTIGPRIQEIMAGADRSAFGERRRAPYSLLPYGSIAVAFAALIAVLPEGLTVRLCGVVAGLGIICGLVAARQLVAFHDNVALIKKLDTTLAELREHEARLRHQALFDGLTALANRTHFHEQVAAELAADVRPALLIIDLDGFKAVNDSRGHAAGDALLVAVSERLRATVRSGDLVARLGGDEFAVLLRDCSVAEAQRIARHILLALAPPVPLGRAQIRVGASIGIAGADDTDDVESLLHHADLAMYAAKNGGKGTCRRYEAGMSQPAAEDRSQAGPAPHPGGEPNSAELINSVST